MKLSDLRAIAAFHRESAANAASVADVMNAPSSADFMAQAQQHATWAKLLEDHAAAFEALPFEIKN